VSETQVEWPDIDWFHHSGQNVINKDENPAFKSVYNMLRFGYLFPRGSVENRPTGVTSKPANGVAQDVVLIYPAFS
jgi:hypothetical protein